MLNKNEKTQIVRDALSKMNLRKDDNDPEKEDFVNDRDLASQLGVGKTTVWNVRQALIQTDENYDVVYAWRWSGDDTCAKIGVSTQFHLLKSRLDAAATYHPTDDPVLIGIMKCRTREQALDEEWGYLNNLFERTRPNREWVIINEVFKEVINEAFISDPSELKKMFGKHIKTEKSYNENS